MLAKNTVSEIRALLNDREEGFDIEAVDRRTKKVKGLVSDGDTIDTDQYRYQQQRIEFESDGIYLPTESTSVSFAQVRAILALLAQAKRSRKEIVVDADDINNELGYTIVARSNGTLMAGCQEFTADEVAYVASKTPKSRKKS